MNLPKWPAGFLTLICASAFLISSRAEEKTSAEVIIKMDPYIVAGERILPPPEDWNYVYVPGTELERGKQVTVAPGFEILSNLTEQNTKLFVDELQLRQLAGSLLWPMIVKTMPRDPLVVIIDRTKQAAGGATSALTLAWQGDPITSFTASSFPNNFDSSAFSTENSNTGNQLVDPNLPLSGQDPGDAMADTVATSTHILVNNNRTISSETSHNDRWLKPLPAGFTYIWAKQGLVTAAIFADEPLSGFGPPTEEQLAADLSRRAAEFALFTFPQPPPRWFQSGMGWLIATTRVTHTRITFADTGNILSTNAMPSLGALLAKTTGLTYEEDLLAAVFTHWGLYGDNCKHAAKLTALVQQQCQAPLTEAQFTEIFGMNFKKMEIELSQYTRSFSSYKSIQKEGQLPDLPTVIVRKATQSEVARLQAASLITQSKPELALNALRIAYWRGEREPAMLAILAGLEEQQGSMDRAHKISQALMTLPAPPPRVFIVDARLHYRDILANKKPEEKLTAKETQTIMGPLGRAVQAGQNSEEIWTFFSDVVLRSGGRPHESIAALLERASKRFPKNTVIGEAAAFAKPTKP